jgi:hypothetical protein
MSSRAFVVRSCSERSSGEAIAVETYPAADATNRTFALPTFIQGSSSRGAGRSCVGTSGSVEFASAATRAGSP